MSTNPRTPPAALYRGERELDRELDEEEAPESPAQGREPRLPGAAHLAGKLDHRDQN
jgi:hypothetical protein